MGIKSITPLQILNSQGEPTLKVKMTADNGSSSYFVVSIGTSVGAKEALKKTDKSDSYSGNSVNSCVDLINKVIAPKFIGYPLDHQQDFDSLLIALDGTENKNNIGANTILALSGAYFKLSAKLSKKPLWQYIAEKQNSNPNFPRIYANIIGGGKHAPGLDIQEFMIVPKSNKPTVSIEQIVQVYKTLRTIMISLYGPTARLVSDEGAVAPVGARTEVVLEALANLNSKMTDKFDIALDVAANSFFDGKEYTFEGQKIHASDLMSIYQQFDTKFDIYSIEDPFAEDDLEGLELIKTMPKEKKPFKIISDDFTVTNEKLINEFGKEKIFDGTIIKPDQVGSISEMFAAINAAKQLGQEVVISHRSGESNDDFIVDLAYGLGANGIKIGAPVRGERVAKYNRLLEIEYSLESLQSNQPEVFTPPTLKTERTDTANTEQNVIQQPLAEPSASLKTPIEKPDTEEPASKEPGSQLVSPAEPIHEEPYEPAPEPEVDEPNMSKPKIEHVTTASNQAYDHPETSKVSALESAVSPGPKTADDDDNHPDPIAPLSVL